MELDNNQYRKSKINVDNSGSNVDCYGFLQRRTTNAVTGNVSDWGYFFTGETGGAMELLSQQVLLIQNLTLIILGLQEEQV